MAIVRYPRLHPGQVSVRDSGKRFNVIRCGRRWGKTTFCEYLLVTQSQYAYPLAYYAPTYKDLEPMWDKVRGRLNDIISHKSETLKSLTLSTGAVIDFWSLEKPDSSRGRAYARAIIDEARKVPKLQYAWNQTIRPTLVDYEGDAWIVSSPQGHGSYLHLLYEKATQDPDWFAYTAPSFENPHLSKEELQAAALSMDDLAYRQEIMGEDVEWTEHARFYEKYERGRHSTLRIEYDPRQTLGISIDFNVDPMTAIAYQTDQWTYFYVLKEFRLPHSEVYGLCAAIRDYFEVGGHVPVYRVTGDPSGRNRHAGMRHSSFDVIRAELGLGSGQIQLLKSAPTHADSRTFVNAAFQHFPKLNINPENEWLIKDLEFVLRGVKPTSGEVIILKDGNVNPFINMKNSELNHLADCLRYALHMDLKNFINIPPHRVALRQESKPLPQF